MGILIFIYVVFIIGILELLARGAIYLSGSYQLVAGAWCVFIAFLILKGRMAK